MLSKSVSIQTLKRLPFYLNYLKSLPLSDLSNISATTIAQALNLNDVQVRKDLALVSKGGRPKIGYVTKSLIQDIEKFLGYDNPESAVIVGAGNLGQALLSFEGFSEYGLNIVAAFDSNDNIIGNVINKKQLLPVDKMKDFCSRMKIRIGIITVPANEAQNACNALIESGVIAIWNFAPVHLTVPQNVLVQNENMACSLAVLSTHLSKRIIESNIMED